MDCKSLMIGDWVFDGEEVARVTSLTCDGIIETTLRLSNIEIVTPIPLTAEILEKNGFERRKLDGGAEEFVLADDYYDITIEEWSDSIWVVRYDCTEMSTPHEQAVCSYVHQLQNFFRLSAPDELADNFKV